MYPKVAPNGPPSGRLGKRKHKETKRFLMHCRQCGAPLVEHVLITFRIIFGTPSFQKNVLPFGFQSMEMDPKRVALKTVRNSFEAQI